MKPENRNNSLLDNGSAKTLPQKQTIANAAVFSVVLAVLVTTQRYGNHTSAAVGQYATIEEAVPSVGGSPEAI
jgi:hypothetical protein